MTGQHSGASHYARQCTLQDSHIQLKGGRVKDGFWNIKISEEAKEKGQGNLLKKPPDIHGPSNKPAQHTFGRKTRGSVK